MLRNVYRNFKISSNVLTTWRLPKLILTDFSRRMHNSNEEETFLRKSDDNSNEFDDAPEGINEVRLLGVVISELTMSDELNSGAFTLATVNKRGGIFERKSYHKISTFNPRLLEDMKLNVTMGRIVYVSGSLFYFKPRESGVRQAVIRPNKLIYLSSSDSMKAQDSKYNL